MKPICLDCSSPLQKAPFSLSIKLNDIFLPAPLCHVKYLQRCWRPTWMSQSVCVLSEKETSGGRGKHWDIHISTLCCLKGGLLLSENSSFENISGKHSQDEGILFFKHGCSVYIWSSQPLQTDGKLQDNDSLWTAVFFPSEFIWYFEWLYLYYRAQCVMWFFKVNLEQNSTNAHTKWLIGLP